MIVANNFVEIAYRQKYNLTFNDEKFLKTSRIFIEADLLMCNEFDKQVEKIRKKEKDKRKLEEEFGTQEVEEFIDLESEFDEQDVKEFWDDDDVYDDDEKNNDEENKNE